MYTATNVPSDNTSIVSGNTSYIAITLNRGRRGTGLYRTFIVSGNTSHTT